MRFGGLLVSSAVGIALLAGCASDDGSQSASAVETSMPAVVTTSSKLDADRAQIVAAAVAQVAKIDNTFGGAKVSSTIQVVENFDGVAGRPLDPTVRGAVVDALRGYAEVVFVADSRSLIGGDPMNAPRGLFIVTTGEPTINGDRAEIRMSMWCGSLCGTSRTYSVERHQATWRITGTVGQIRVS
jgi:hypothetical protein